MPSPKPFEIKSNDRCLVVGRTGGGKSFLAKRLTRSIRRLVILDPKGRMTLKEVNAEPDNGESHRKLSNGDDVRILFQPDRNEENESKWQRALELAYDAQDCTIYIDEMYLVVPPSRQAPQILNACITTGRELGIGVWTLTQRPTWIPLFAVSEADHYFMFNLTLDEDRKRMAAFMGLEVMQPIRDEHGFFYSRPTNERPNYFSKLEA